MRLPVEGQKRFVGTIVGADDQGRVRLECEAGELVFDLSEMDKARLKPDI
jgi:ribosome maturation factor RimP